MQFSSSRYVSVRTLQIFRVFIAISLTPIIVVSVLMNGFGFFIMYATQWGIFATIMCFILIWRTARLELQHHTIITRTDDEAVVGIADPNYYTQFQQFNHTKRLTALRDKRKKKAFQRTSITEVFSKVMYQLIIAGFFIMVI